VRTLSLRELNRTLLARQLLAERTRAPVVRVVARLVALQAQYAPSPYVALWSRLEGFRKEQLTRGLTGGTIVKAGALRTTLHVMAGSEFPYLISAYIDAQRGRTMGLGVDIEALRAAIPDEPASSSELNELAHRVLGTDDPWTVAFAWRALPFVRTAPVGPWPHTKVSPAVLWREPLPEAQESATRVVHQYLAAYGPASRDDIAQYTYFKFRQIDPALEGLRTFEDEQGVTLYDVPRSKLAHADAPAPVRFLPAFDSIILAHRDRSRILPDEYRDVVINKKNATTKNTFTVDGFVAGAWRVEKQKLVVDAFEPLPLRVRREVEAEGERLLAFYAS
jgi:Winged helix DNA-binding domain